MAEILGIMGLQGWGKTALTTGLGILAHNQGWNLYSNYPLKNIDYTYFDTVKEAQNIRGGYILFDEFWEWVHARTSQSKINKLMMEICLLNRKRGNSIIYNTQLPRTIDVILKEVTNYRYVPFMVKHIDGNKYVHYIQKDVLGNESAEMVYPMPINELGKFFDTHYEVKKPGIDNKSFLEIAKTKYEKPFLSAIKRKKWKANLLINSGLGSPYKYDVEMVNKYDRYGINVKSTGNKNVTICNNESNIKKDMHEFLNNAKEWKYIPLIAFPIKDKKGDYLRFPSNWYIYQIHKGSYFLNYNSNELDYHKLSKESKILSKWSGKPLSTTL